MEGGQFDDLRPLAADKHAADRRAGRLRRQGPSLASTLTRHAALRLSLESCLRLALQHNERVLHYQPKADLASRPLSGWEARIRWQEKGEGLIYPDQFVPIAE